MRAGFIFGCLLRWRLRHSPWQLLDMRYPQRKLHGSAACRKGRAANARAADLYGSLHCSTRLDLPMRSAGNITLLNVPVKMTQFDVSSPCRDGSGRVV